LPCGKQVFSDKRSNIETQFDWELLVKLILTNWRAIVNGLAIVLIVLTQLLNASPVQAESNCNHGMRVVGDQSIYLSHMGLFDNRCHEYQAIFEVAFEGKDNPQKIYLDAQQKDPNKNEFTIKPLENFALTDLEAGKRTSFQAELHSGQFERNPLKIASNVTVKIKRVLHFRQFKAGEKQPAHSEYLLFGTPAEQMAAHLIAAPSDFDQIVAIKIPLALTDADLAKAVHLVFPNRATPNEEDNLTLALKPGGPPPAVIVNDQLPNKSIEVRSQYYLETDDFCGCQSCTSGCQPRTSVCQKLRKKRCNQ
jgi:hypothetical protein